LAVLHTEYRKIFNHPCIEETNKMNKAHQIKLYPTKSQEVLFRKSCGVARYSYNWGLSKWKEWYELGKRPSAYSLIKYQNSIKREETPFFMEVSKTAPQYAIHNLQTAFSKFLKKNAKYPKYKKKGVNDSFVSVENKEAFCQKDFKIRLPRIGWVKCAENLRFSGKVNNVVVRRIADMWFASINIEVPDSAPILKRNTGDNQAIVGVDFGIKSMMVLSDGTIFENPRALKTNLKRLKQRQRRLSKKQKGSNNRRKAKMKIARTHYRVTNIRRNAIHQATAVIAKKYDKVIIEDLNVSGMGKNGNLARSLSDVSFAEIRRQLAYKGLWNGKELVVADRFFPSSKTCSGCGNKKVILKLSERTYKCESCGLEIDRDLNAAINLANYSPTAKSAESNACGGSEIMPQGKCLPMNQESNLITIKT
jgi:putative transposase